jgi:hypothetical protein
MSFYSRLNGAFLCILFGLIATSNVLADPIVYMCVKEGPYYINGRIAGTMRYGQLFDGEPNPRDHRWVDIKSSRGVIGVSREHIMAAGDIAFTAAERASEGKRRIQQAEEGVADKKAELRDIKRKLLDAKATIRRDTIAGALDSNGNAAIGASVSDTYYDDEYIEDLEKDALIKSKEFS